MAAKKRAPRKANPALVNETKEQKFVRLANQRVNAAIKRIGLCENLARYAHTPAQGQLVVATLGAAVNGVDRAFSVSVKQEASRFDVTAA